MTADEALRRIRAVFTEWITGTIDANQALIAIAAIVGGATPNA
jgi:hypothetical protein